MEGSLPICTVCGGTEYVKEHGFFYCKECQTQSQEIREQIVGNDVGSVASVEKETSKTVKTKRKKGNRQAVGENDLTSWEIFNSILIGQVHELIELGAPPAIKNTVLQLWVYYLQKLEVAFISRRLYSLPRLGPGYSPKDAALIYGMHKSKRKKRKRTSRSTSVMSTAGTSDWESYEKKKALKMSKRALMTQESLLLSEGGETTDFSQSSVLDQSSRLSRDGYSSDVSTVDGSVTRVRYSSIAKETLQRRRTEIKGAGSISSVRVHYTQPASISRFKLVVLLYLALLYHGSNIHLSDLLRWIREGHVAYHDVTHFLPLGHTFSLRQFNSFGAVESMPSYCTFMKAASSLAHFLDMTDWHVPDVKYLAHKYVTELNLPTLFGTLIERFVSMMPLTYLWHDKEIPKYEIRIVAILIIVMKLLMGLDGKTEQEISTVASELNRLERKKSEGRGSIELFVWSDWVQHIECRNAVIAHHHFPSKECLFPDVYNPGVFVSHWKHWAAAHPEARERFRSFYINAIPAEILDVVRETLNKLSSQPKEEHSIEFPATLKPFSTYTKCILKAQSRRGSVDVSASAFKMISKDFSDCDAHYLLEPQKCSELAEKHNWDLRVKYQSAQKNFTPLPKREAKKEIKRNVVYLVKNSRNLRKLDKKRRVKEGGGAAASSVKRNRGSSGRPKYIYAPSSQYWLWEGSFDDLADKDFDGQVASAFPVPFLLLLDECAYLTETTKKIIFQEILLIEQIYKKYYKCAVESVS